MAFGKEDVVIDGGAAITIDSAFESDALALSVTLTVKFAVPVVDGVPLITPVPAFMVKPGGSDPGDTVQLKGLVPPEAATGWE